jgi:hypothetical protein
MNRGEPNHHSVVRATRRSGSDDDLAPRTSRADVLDGVRCVLEREDRIDGGTQ